MAKLTLGAGVPLFVTAHHFIERPDGRQETAVRLRRNREDGEPYAVLFLSRALALTMPVGTSLRLTVETGE